jgi:hypothetical protein
MLFYRISISEAVNGVVNLRYLKTIQFHKTEIWLTRDYRVVY